jgi:hypothetical protein
MAGEKFRCEHAGAIMSSHFIRRSRSERRVELIELASLDAAVGSGGGKRMRAKTIADFNTNADGNRSWVLPNDAG